MTLVPQGEPPSHPELLDWLANDFIANGWSLKHTIRQIVLSQTYRQDSVANVDLDPEQIATVDPTNTLLHRHACPTLAIGVDSRCDSCRFRSTQSDAIWTGRADISHTFHDRSWCS